jgi:predicted dehydrogenase
MDDRRDFLKATTGGLLLLKPQTVFGTQANSAVEFGVVGCGSRGTWITGHFHEHTLARLVACADPFQDKLDTARDKFKVDPKRLYGGLNGYRELVESNLDAVVIQSPPYFHPEQAEAAVNAGKHVFMPKPVAVDVFGCKRVAAAGEKAARAKLSYWVDFQTRASKGFQEAAARVHAGDIGKIVFGHVYYHAGRNAAPDVTGLSQTQARLRGWLHDKQLSGDIIVEQNIHVLDCFNWYAQAHPIAAQGSGHQSARMVGDVWDNFIVTYTYPHGVRVDFSSTQFLKGYGDLCIRVYGTEGTLDSHYNSFLRITGTKPWPGVEKDNTFNGGAIENVKAFIESVRSAKPINNAETGSSSTLTAVLGRMAAQTGKPLTWDEMMRSNDRVDAKISM